MISQAQTPHWRGALLLPVSLILLSIILDTLESPAYDAVATIGASSLLLSIGFLLLSVLPKEGPRFSSHHLLAYWTIALGALVPISFIVLAVAF